MALTPGTRLGPYEILAPLGAGGMGEVYRARDGTLHRDVALKVLPEAFASDPDRLARFRREAQVLAALNHPNIAAIYGFEESTRSAGSGQASVHALVLELVEGPTLADRIAQGRIPIEESLPIAKQIAEALEAAHEQGIIHRDLKPANIKLRPDGVVKVLDFGLAKALALPNAGQDLSPTVPAGARDAAYLPASQAPTISSPAMMPFDYRSGQPEHGRGLTGIGVILGTAAYMSPEQAKGREADKRSDVWAFGAVLYEMLTGRRAFEGDDLSDTLANVLKSQPDWTALPATTPPTMIAVLRRCLHKDRKLRVRDIGDVALALDGAFETAPHQASVSVAAARPFWRRAIPVTLVVIVTGALAGASAWYFKPSPTLSVTRLPFALPEGQAFTAATRNMIAISPDGTQMVYAATPSQLYLRSMSELDVKAIRGSEGSSPVFSPDGRSIAFYSNQDLTLKRIAATGGTAVTICSAVTPFGISWGPDGLVFGQGSKGIMRVSPDGGTPTVVAGVKDGEEAGDPQLLPGGQHVLFALATGTGTDRWDKAQIVVQSLTSEERTVLSVRGSAARYVPTGHLVYAVDGSLFAVTFDVQRLEVTGEPTPMVEGVRRSAGSVTGAASFSVSNTGSLIYIPGPVSRSSAFDIALIDRKGAVERLKLPPGPYLTPRMSPDGMQIAFGTDESKEAIVWIYALSGTTQRRLTFEGNNRFPIWSADGTRVAFQSDRDGDLAIFWQPADSTGTAVRLTTPDQGTSHVPQSWSPTGDSLLYDVRKGSDVSLWTFSLQDRKGTPFGEVHSSNPTDAAFSRDGRWVAYASTERGKTTIYVQPFPATGSKYQLLAREAFDSPHEGTWSADGKELFYNPRAGVFEAVSVMTEPTFAFGSPVAVPRPFRLSPPEVRRTYDVTPGGKFVGLIGAGQTQSGTPANPEATVPQVQVVLNWFQELKRLVPVN